MSSIDMFIRQLEDRYYKAEEELLTMEEKEEERVYMKGRADAYKEITFNLKRIFELDCKHRTESAGRSLDHCKLKGYCDPRGCLLKESRELKELEKIVKEIE